MDNSGTTGVFDDEHTEIEKGKSYLVLVGNNRIMEYVPIDELNTTKSGFVRFLSLKHLPMQDNEYFVLKWKARKTKAGKNMATLVVANSMRCGVWSCGLTLSLSVTPGSWRRSFEMEFGQTKSGDILKDVMIKEKV